MEGIAGLFNFEFPSAIKRFREVNVKMVSLLTYSAMVEVASEIHYIEPSDIETLREWRKDPGSWTPSKRF